jgi:hypothetical protein
MGGEKQSGGLAPFWEENRFHECFWVAQRFTAAVPKSHEAPDEYLLSSALEPIVAQLQRLKVGHSEY